MMVKVKEPLPEEYPLFREGLILYTYLHLAADKEQMDALLDGKIKAVAYETLQESDGSLPLLAPMSQIAGRLAVQEGAKYLEKTYGGRGVLLAGVPGTPKANVERAVKDADLVIGAVLIPGGSTPKLFKRAYLPEMKPGAVFVDVAIDQGGCGESSHVTNHDDPVYIEEGVVHYAVGNMPGAVARTSTIALTNATLRYGLEIANKGLEQAVADNAAIALGVNCYDGKICCKNLADSYADYDYVDIHTLV